MITVALWNQLTALPVIVMEIYGVKTFLILNLIVDEHIQELGPSFSFHK